MNTLRPSYTVTEDRRISHFAVLQTAVAAHPVLRDHRLTIGLYSGDSGLVRTHQVKVDISGALTEIPSLVGLEAPSVVLLNDEDLTYAKVRFDPASDEVIRRRAGDLADPLARAVAWTALWDMTQDGEFAASSIR